MKKQQLDELKNLCISLSNETSVFGEGSLDAFLMLVGEAPGAKEEELSKPFAGTAGKILNEFLESLNLERDEIYITNAVKIRPYKFNEKTGRKSNRPPSKEEIEKYRSILLKEIEIVRPKIIATLGNCSLKSVCGNHKAAVGDVHGKLIEKETFLLYPLYHPAALIYNRSLKEIYLNDLQRLKKILDAIR